MRLFQPKKVQTVESGELRAMMEAVRRSQAVIEFGLDGVVLDANPNFLTVLGYELSDICGEHHCMFVAPGEAQTAAYQDLWRRLRAGEFVAGKFERYGRSGRRVVIEASYNPIFDASGRPYKVVKFATDITAVETEREQRARDDRAAAERHRLAVDGLGRGISALAEGDLTYRISEEFPGDYEALKTNFNAAMSKLDQLLRVIIANAETMSESTSEVSHAATDLSSRTERQAASLEQTAAALDEIAATVANSAEHALSADALMASTRQDVEHGGDIAVQAVAAMNTIERSSEEIGQIVGVIDEIAFQTNLLALNAGVEAARAGDAGRGFAVVASEVRALAQRSAQSAKEIKILVSQSLDQVKQGVGLVRQSNTALSTIGGRVRDVTDLISQVRRSSQEQAVGISQVNTAVNALDQVTQQNAAMVEETTAACLSLTENASTLGELTKRFRVGSSRQEGATGRPAAFEEAYRKISSFHAERGQGLPRTDLAPSGRSHERVSPLHEQAVV